MQNPEDSGMKYIKVQKGKWEIHANMQGVIFTEITFKNENKTKIFSDKTKIIVCVTNTPSVRKMPK